MSSEENGFLTDRDKAFLQADGDYYTGENAKNQRYETREVIAERARQAFHDFALLNDVLDNRERNRIFDPDEREVADLLQALRETIAFLYRTLEGDVGQQDIQRRSFRYNFNSVFEPGVRDGEVARQPEGPTVAARGFVEYEPFSVQVKRNPPVPAPERVVEELAENGGRGLSTGELQAAIWRAAFDTEAGVPRSAPDDYEKFDLHTLADRVAERQAGDGDE
jgi:hypothetical protein